MVHTLSVDYQQLLEKHLEHEKLELQKQEEEDEALVKYAVSINIFTIAYCCACTGKCSMVEEEMPILSDG